MRVEPVVPPWDDAAEQAVLAELAQPLHPGVLGDVSESDFYHSRHARLYRHIRGETLRVPVSAQDLIYLAELCRFASPITRSVLDRFRDCADRRARLYELEQEREGLLDGR